MRALAVEAGGGIPAAALTACAGNKEREMAIEAGFQRHMVKPIESVVLGLMLANLVGGF